MNHPSCAERARRAPLVARRGRIEVRVDTDAHDGLDLSAARILLLVLEELRVDGIAVHRVRVSLDPRDEH